MIELYNYNTTEAIFKRENISATITYSSDREIINVIANDINGDKLLDLVVTTIPAGSQGNQF